MICLDASVIIKLLVQERQSDRIHGLFEHWLNEEEALISSQFSQYEIYSVLRKKQSFGELSDQEIKNAIIDLQALPISYIVDMDLLPSALLWSKKTAQPTIYDCLYLSVAEREHAVLWTCDGKFYAKAHPLFSEIQLV